MSTLRYVVEIATTDTRIGVAARIRDELTDAVRLRFGTVTVTAAPPAPTYPPGACETAP